MKIGLIGNMNNNNFAFLRYLINLGYDANLIIFKNEISGNNKHFSPKADSWNIRKWKKYIIQSNLSEDPVSIFNFPFSYLFSLKSIFETLSDKKNVFKKPVKKKEIFKLFSKYDFLIGSGITPAILNRVDIKLDIFYPYSFGIEWLGSPTFKKKLQNKNFIIRFLAKKILKNQLKGIKSAKKIITVLDSVTKNVLSKHDLKAESSFIPMLYNLEKSPNKIHIGNKNIIIKNRVKNIANEIVKSDFSIFCHSRHIWCNDENLNEEDWKKINKNSDWIVRGFSNFLKKTTKKAPILIMLEYGKDFNETKNLCRDLKIEKNVFWLPKLERKNIMWFLSTIDVGVGEFYEIDNMLFGGTGYEVLSSGKPFIQSFNFNEDSFKKQYSSPLPPVLAASNIIEIENHLMKLSLDKNYYEKISRLSKIWFNEYCGIGLAKTIIESSLQK